MARQPQQKNENRRVRSFNLDDAHYREMKRLSAIEGISMSDILNRMLWHQFAQAKVEKDIENGIQTTLEIHVSAEEIRAKRKDGKCNPKHILGKCSICWGEE